MTQIEQNKLDKNTSCGLLYLMIQSLQTLQTANAQMLEYVGRIQQTLYKSYIRPRKSVSKIISIALTI